jgi:glucuronate isomerase
VDTLGSRLVAHDALLFAPSRSALAGELYAGVAALPLVCPHGHVDPWLLADPDATLGEPAGALVSSDHYVFRMLHSRGVPLAELGVGGSGADPRAVWQRFAEGFSLFAATPTGLWLTLELRDVFGIETRLAGETAQEVYDELAEKLTRAEFAPRALFERFGIEVLCTTDSLLDDLAAHEALRAAGWGERVRPTLRTDPVMRADAADWAESTARLGELTDVEVHDFASLGAALSARMAAFKALGATGIDVSVTSPRAETLPDAEADALVQRGLGGTASAEDGERLAARLVLQLAELCREHGLVMQLHAGSLRNHHADGFARFGRDIGADIPVAVEWTRSLAPLLNAHGDDPGFGLVAYTLDESTLSRELAPLAGYYPALTLGAPWWFLDSPAGMRRYLDAVAPVCGLANTAGFVDDTRAFPSIPARHQVWRRVCCDWLAGLVLTGELAEEDAHALARGLAVDLARAGYRLG